MPYSPRFRQITLILLLTEIKGWRDNNNAPLMYFFIRITPIPPYWSQTKRLQNCLLFDTRQNLTARRTRQWTSCTLLLACRQRNLVATCYAISDLLRQFVTSSMKLSTFNGQCNKLSKDPLQIVQTILRMKNAKQEMEFPIYYHACRCENSVHADSSGYNYHIYRHACRL